MLQKAFNIFILILSNILKNEIPSLSIFRNCWKKYQISLSIKKEIVDLFLID